MFQKNEISHQHNEEYKSKIMTSYKRKNDYYFLINKNIDYFIKGRVGKYLKFTQQ